jgi:hypothetical protein
VFDFAVLSASASATVLSNLSIYIFRKIFHVFTKIMTMRETSRVALERKEEREMKERDTVF